MMTLLSSLALLSLLTASVMGQAWKGESHSDLALLLKKAKAGDAEAMAECAFHSMRCMGGLKYEPDLIFDFFTRSAAAGSTEGKVGLAHCYCFNVGTPRDLWKALELIEEPLQEEHPVALKVMGFMYSGGQ